MKAAIDIGTNTVLLLVAELKNGIITPVYEDQRIPRLGRGIDSDRSINELAFERVTSALLDYKQILNNSYPEVNKITVTATSAVRDARNKLEFIEEIKNRTGFEIRLLSGKEEAEWTAAGALSMLGTLETDNSMIIDIGGGSTELAMLNELDVIDSHSFDMGSVRFTERYLKNDPPTDTEIRNCSDHIKEYYASRTFEMRRDATSVAVAGTATTVAAIQQNLKQYDPQMINGFEITISGLDEVLNDFRSVSSTDMLNRHPVFLKGRADIFVAGMLILKGFMNFYSIPKLMVSTGGIRHGAILLGGN